MTCLENIFIVVLSRIWTYGCIGVCRPMCVCMYLVVYVECRLHVMSLVRDHGSEVVETRGGMCDRCPSS